ncbi:winged helix-turn-helix domain-containing protein [Erwinia psidii]|uniref:Helix-turn-helix domain-containing protein n=1 Tax=Erwinia psidii TaxID=69224 RepID=A0A3N6UR32_9GAMM|nr:helix-turn-helix domain-containing protein [Erwinia psidii]MCX8957833.1 helix-turn-helix domain-containing protein [Erwinia psidii]MCX8960883.1 helix-turn-helix domain-containing protein [Erwinia psidii]MCX8964877.1 helix-turn-helix domain-containing protein [Erwinia psidii]RQM38449.1 helix-turn-helix domain-containing protein [Erwinia psidii]
MDQHSRKVFGYVIERDIQVNIIQSRVININHLNHDDITAIVTLRKTMMRLFIYLLENADSGVIQHEDILLNVWDKYGLSSSNQRLWQVMRCLRNKLSSLGIPDDFITRIESGPHRGYQISKNKVTTVYYYVQENL